jgi:hypothetical protein
VGDHMANRPVFHEISTFYSRWAPTIRARISPHHTRHRPTSIAGTI